jgi:hypothetical protein
MIRYNAFGLVSDSNLSTPERKISLIMLVLLDLLVFVYTLGSGVYVVNGLEPSPTWEFLFRAAFLCGVVWWLKADAKRSAVQPVYCSGLIVGIGWLIIIPYHLLKTRGAKGLIPLFALIGCYFVAQVLTIVVYLALLTSNPP